MEILNIPTPSRTRLQAKLRLYKSEAEKLKRDLVKTKQAIAQDNENYHAYRITSCREEAQQLFLKTRTGTNYLAALDRAMMTV